MKKIVLIGDSIRKGYDRFVKLAFKEVANVCYTEDNCRFAAYVLRHIYDWKNEFGGGGDVDLVHWNAGLWDSLIMEDGEPVAPVEIYKYYIERVCKLIKSSFPKAKVIFATSTPVREELFGVLKRYNKDIEMYNAVAVEIAQKYGFEINDLYEIVKTVPKDYYSDMTHLYTKEGTRLISDKVIGCIENALEIKADKLDYDRLFEQAENIIGM